jgi:rhomboid protease GluP
MKNKLINSIAKTLITSDNFLPISDEKNQLLYDDNTSILQKPFNNETFVIQFIDLVDTTENLFYQKIAELNLKVTNINSKSFTTFILVCFFDGKNLSYFNHYSTKISTLNLEFSKHFKVIGVDTYNKSFLRILNSHKLPTSIETTITNSLSIESVEEVSNKDIIDISGKIISSLTVTSKVKKPYFTFTLLGINLLVAFLFYMMSQLLGTPYEEIILIGAKFNLSILDGEYWRLITPIFLHSGIPHLFFNSLSLYYLGPNVEHIYGHKKFLIIYFFAGIMGNVASFAFSPAFGVGASGAIFGLMGALLFFGIEKPIIFKRGSGMQLIVLFILNIVYGFSVENIDNYAHIGGAIAGFLMTGALSTHTGLPKFFNKTIMIVLTLTLTVGGFYYSFNNSLNKNALFIFSEFEKLSQVIKTTEDVMYNSTQVETISEQLLEKEIFNYPLIYIYTMKYLIVAELYQSKDNEANEHISQLLSHYPSESESLEELISTIPK